MINKTTSAAIFVDKKQSRIRIHRQTIRLLDNPQFIKIFINPVSMTMAIGQAEPFEASSYAILQSCTHRKPCCELHSKKLIQGLYKICANWNIDKSYRIFGNVVPEENIVVFGLLDAIPCAEDNNGK